MIPLLLQLLSRFAKQGLGFLFGIVIVRYYGVTIYGSYGKIMVIANLCLGAITTAFINNYMRSCSSAAFKSSLTGVLIATSVFLAIGGMGLGKLFDVDTRLLMLGLLVVGLTGLSEIYVILSRINRQDGLAIIIRTLPIILSIVSAVIFAKQSVLLLMSLIALSWLTVFFFLPINEIIKEFNIYKTFDHFRPIFVLFITALSTQLYGNFDQLLIENAFDLDSLALYRIAYTIASLAVPVIGVFSFFYITGLKNKLNNKQIIRRFRNQIFINLGFGLIILGCSFFIVEDLVYYLYQIRHKDLKNIVTLHLVGVVLNSVGMVYSYSLLLIKKDLVILVVTICAALLSVLLNMVLIEYLGMIGAAYTSMVTQLLILLAFMVYFHLKADFFRIMSS